MTSTFIDLKIDYAFKMVLGREGREPSLRNFLNAMLYDGTAVIKSIEILNPYLPGQVESLKDTFVDVLAKLNDGSIVIIEMQMSMKPDFFKRMIFNVAKKYSTQLQSGEYYSELNPVIGLVVANFVYPEAAAITRPITKYALLETSDHILYPDSQEFQIAIVELPKFQKHLEQLEDEADMWLYLLNYADGLAEVPPKMAQVAEIQKAFEAAKKANLSPIELDELEKRRMYAMEAEANLAWARQNALEEGLQQGLQQGLQKGLMQGREEGFTQGQQDGFTKAQRQIIRQMLDRQMTPKDIANITGIPLSEIEQIQRDGQK